MTTLHEAAKALVQRIDRGRKEYQEAWPDDDRELDALRAALASPPAPAEGERDEVYAAARALLDAISHWDLTVAVDVASARLERALARAPRPQHEGGRP